MTYLLNPKNKRPRITLPGVLDKKLTMTSHLDYQTPKLKRSILELVTLVEDSVQKAITAFQQKNLELAKKVVEGDKQIDACLLYTSPSPRDATLSRMPSSA